jgi:AraC family transcriptional regulator
MIIGSTNLYLVQRDGYSPAALTAGSAPGESGVSVVRARFRGGVHFRATLEQHLVCFYLTVPVRIECRMASRALYHEAPVGSLAILPAGADSTADTDESVDALLVEVHRGRLALAAAEDSTLDARLTERLSGRDPALFDLACRLARESEAQYPNGSLFWNEVASAFIDRLIARHTSGFDGRARGTLSKNMLARIKEHVLAHLDQPIDVATLAGIAGHSRFHFCRVFARSVGMTPHRYVVHLRLQRAVELIREGRSGLADIAADTGFADQSHLTRWVRRVHGVSLTELGA